MKKRSWWYVFFLISFIMYSLIWFANPYVTARTWADIMMCIFLGAVCYHLVYVFYLRKRDYIKFGRAVALYFLCLFISQEIFALLYWCNLFFDGYIATDFLGNQISEPVYGFEAIKNDKIALYLFAYLFAISTVYQLIYFVVVSWKERRK